MRPSTRDAAQIAQIAEALKRTQIPLDEWKEGVERTTSEWTKVRLPPGWREFEIPVDHPLFGGSKAAVNGKSSVMFSAGEFDGRWWLHVSIAHPERIPSYMELVEAKRIFVGKDRQAFQLFTAEGDHVNIHPRCLHLWCSLEPDGDGLPNFGREGTI